MKFNGGFSDPPNWLVISTVNQSTDIDLLELDRGEQAAILLAEALEATLVLMDERKGRSIARSRGLRITGLIGILDSATEIGMIDLPTVLAKLRTTNFRASPQLIKSLLKKHNVE